MPTFIKHIYIQNVHGISDILKFSFKDYRMRHMLIYGYNGSGKTSLFRTINDFLNASIIEKPDITTIKNRFNRDLASEIKITIETNGEEKTFTWNKSKYESDPILKDGLRSFGCISYNDVLELSFAFRHHRYMEVSSYLNRMVFRFAETRWTSSLADIETQIQQHINTNGHISSNHELIETYNSTLTNVMYEVARVANGYLSSYFSDITPKSLRIMLDVNEKRKDQNLPQIRLSVLLSDYVHPIHDFHVFMNEALVSAVAFSLYFASLKLTPHKSDLKLLILDDIHLTLDDSHRKNLMNLIISEFATGYQIIFLSHDSSYCNYLVSSKHSKSIKWDYRTLENPSLLRHQNPDIFQKDVLNQYISANAHERLLDELRKHVEQFIAKILDTHNPTVSLPFKDFTNQTFTLDFYHKTLSEFIRTKYHDRIRDYNNAFHLKMASAKKLMNGAHHHQINPKSIEDNDIYDAVDATLEFFKTVNNILKTPTATVPTATVPTATVPTATVPTATVPTATVPTATVPALSLGNTINGTIRYTTAYKVTVKCDGIADFGTLKISRYDTRFDQLATDMKVKVKIISIEDYYTDKNGINRRQFSLELVDIL